MSSLFDSALVREWVARADAVPVLEAWARVKRQTRLKRAGREQVGPCPACGGTDRFAINTAKNRWNCRGSGGGGSVKLLMHCDDLSFLDAVEALTGEPCPKGRREMTAEEASARAVADAGWRGRRDGRDAYHAAGGGLGRPVRVSSGAAPADLADADRASAWVQGFLDAVAAERRSDEHREAERKRAVAIWQGARPAPPDGAVAAYLAHRGLSLPEAAPVREAVLPYWHGEGADGRPRALHEGPAMLWPLVRMVEGERRFAGLHISWIDHEGLKAGTAARNGRPALFDPDTGEALPTKKFRGSSRAAMLPLAGPAAPAVLVMGEGPETALSVRQAMLAAGRDVSAWAFWAAGSLGEMGGPAACTRPHPTLKCRNGQARRVPGPEPLWGAPAMALPDSVAELILLGDGDSEPVLTRWALERAAARHGKRADGEPRRVRIAMAPAGTDFNDWWREGASRDC